jgi:hypothetical protein
MIMLGTFKLARLSHDCAAEAGGIIPSTTKRARVMNERLTNDISFHSLELQTAKC